jgi:hypothetical protein
VPTGLPTGWPLALLRCEALPAIGSRSCRRSVAYSNRAVQISSYARAARHASPGTSRGPGGPRPPDRGRRPRSGNRVSTDAGGSAGEITHTL